MRRLAVCVAVCAAVLGSTAIEHVAASAPTRPPVKAAARGVSPAAPSAGSGEQCRAHIEQRLADDRAAMQVLRPGHEFWQHIFTIPDGAIAYGSGVDGRLLAVFPATGDWLRGGSYKDTSVAAVLAGAVLPRDLEERREFVAQRLEAAFGPVVHNQTRGLFLLSNVPQYGGFLKEWGTIYERFGVPADIGLAQAIVESGLSGTVRSEARAIGFCQWLLPNWNHLKRLAPHPIEGFNQTTQAPYCAAYLSVLATKYGTFIPALSEHHAGGTNVGRMVINGQRLGAVEPRRQYLAGAELARDLRLMAPGDYKDLYGSYGPRSFRYAEMVFGNAATAARLQTTVRQTSIFAMRVPRAFTLAEVASRAGVTAEEVRRFNRALTRRVPAGASVYLPRYVKALGPDVSFWHRAASASYTAALNDFVRLHLPLETWDTPAILPVLEDFERRFQLTRTEEGDVMATVLAYVRDDIRTGGRDALLTEFRSSPAIDSLFGDAVRQWNVYRTERGQARAVN
jgi:hypothetical protein